MKNNKTQCRNYQQIFHVKDFYEHKPRCVKYDQNYSTEEDTTLPNISQNNAYNLKLAIMAVKYTKKL